MAAWKCQYCGIEIERNPDDPDSEEWVERQIAACKKTHAQQLAEDHSGDKEALRLQLQHPALAAAIQEVQTTMPIAPQEETW